MSNFQEWCVKVLPFIQAAASGEVVQASCDNGNFWVDLSTVTLSDPALQFDFDDYDYRIKPITIMIGDIEVPEPMLAAPKKGDYYYLVSLSDEDVAPMQVYDEMSCEEMWLRRGLCHHTKEAAITHAKALIALTAKKDTSHE